MMWAMSRPHHKEMLEEIDQDQQIITYKQF